MKDLTNEQISSIWHAQAASGKGSGFYDIIRAAIKADRELNGREAQPADQANGQEPVGAVLVNRDTREGVMFYSSDMIPDASTLKDRFELVNVYTTPPTQPAREWVGLTDEEVQVMAFRAVKAHPEWRHLNCTVPVGAEAAPFVAELYRAIEAKLRAKNAGLLAAVPDDPVQAVLSEIFTDTEAPHKIDVLFSTDSRDVTVVYSNLDCQWLEELKAAVAQRALPADDHPLMHSKPAKPQAPDMEASE